MIGSCQIRLHAQSEGTNIRPFQARNNQLERGRPKLWLSNRSRAWNALPARLRTTRPARLQVSASTVLSSDVCARHHEHCLQGHHGRSTGMSVEILFVIKRPSQPCAGEYQRHHRQRRRLPRRPGPPRICLREMQEFIVNECHQRGQRSLARVRRGPTSIRLTACE